MIAAERHWITEKTAKLNHPVCFKDVLTSACKPRYVLCWVRGFVFVSMGEEKLWISSKLIKMIWTGEISWLEEVIVHQTAWPFNLNWLARLINAFHLIRYKFPKGKLPKLGLGHSFVFVFPGEWRHPNTESEDHWTNKTCEEKGQIMQRKYPKKKSKLAYCYIPFPTG